MNKVLKSYLASHDKDNQCNQLHLTKDIFLVEEKNKKEKLKVSCNSSFYKVDIDNCLIKNSGGNNPKKCDFIVGSHDNQFVFLVELKSKSDIEKTPKKFDSMFTHLKIQKQDTICVVVVRKFSSGMKTNLKIALKKIKFNYFTPLSYNETLNIDEEISKALKNKK